MIQNETQYRITRSQAEKFKSAIAEHKISAASRANIHPRLLRAEQEAMESVLKDMSAELKEYETLSQSPVPILEIQGLSGLPEGLIKARIATGLSQKELADRMKLKPQQIQRYEAEMYERASLKRVLQVVDALGIKIKMRLNLGNR